MNSKHVNSEERQNYFIKFNKHKSQNTGERLWANKIGMLMQTLVTQIIAETLACVIAGVILHLFFDEKGHQK